jgi:hypothetical protein
MDGGIFRVGSGWNPKNRCQSPPSDTNLHPTRLGLDVDNPRRWVECERDVEFAVEPRLVVEVGFGEDLDNVPQG